MLIGLIGVTGLVLLTSACSRSSMKTRYDICIVNRTGQDLDWVCAYYGNTKVAEPGRLVKGGNATEALITVPVAPEAEVRWDGNGTHHAVKVKLEGVVPRGLRYFNLYFIINEDSSVSVKVIKADDIDANAKVIK
jgi:hypothetical protein